MIVTIDGPAGSGKSTLSKLLAAKLGYRFLDTGATYRAVTYLIQKNYLPVAEGSALDAILDTVEVKFEGSRVVVNGEDVTEAIRTPEVEKSVSEVSAMPSVRKRMVDIQRRIAAAGDYVAEGRDMGSVVFPDAKVKFYLDASPEERARRRFEQNRAKGMSADYDTILAEIRRRDAYDSSREISPLTIPVNACVIDTTGLSIEQVLHKMLSIVLS